MLVIASYIDKILGPSGFRQLPIELRLIVDVAYHVRGPQILSTPKTSTVNLVFVLSESASVRLCRT